MSVCFWWQRRASPFVIVVYSWGRDGVWGRYSGSERETLMVLEVWRIRFDPGRLPLISSVVIWGAQYHPLRFLSLSFFLFYILHSSLLPSLPIKPCIKDSYGTYSVFRIHDAHAVLFPPCSFCTQPSPLCHPLLLSNSLPSHISEFPLIRILKLNPPNSPFHSGLAFSPLVKRTIGWEGQNKRRPCLWCAVLDPWAYFLSVSLSLIPFSSGWDRRLLILCLSYLLGLSFLPASSSHVSLPDMASMHMHSLWPLMDSFFINKFLSLIEAHVVGLISIQHLILVISAWINTSSQRMGYLSQSPSACIFLTKNQ